MVLLSLTSTETIRLIRDGEKGKGGVDYIPVATLSPPEWLPALRWVAMRTILLFHSLWGTNFTKSQDSVHRPQLLKRNESQSGLEPRSLCLPAWRLSARPNRLMLPLPVPQEQCSSVLPVYAMFQHLQYTGKLYLIRHRNINGYFILVLSVFSTDNYTTV